MLHKKTLLVFILFVFFAGIFFNRSIIKGEVPFPGDLLIGEYNPYSSYSFLGYAPGGFPHKAQNIDVIEQLYPWKFLSIELLKRGEFPLWNPYNFSGTPHLAAIQSGTFYPLNLLFFIMPFLLAWSVYIIIQPVLAGFFTYLFLKELKVSLNSAIFGGLAFSFSSFLVVWMQYGNIIHAALWLPLILWLGLKNLKKPTFTKSILMSFLLSFSILAGHFQVSIYLYMFSFLFLLFIVFKIHRSRMLAYLGILIGIYLLSLLISSVQLLPSIEIFINSSRSNYSYDRIIEFLIPTYHSISILFPDFFGNPVTRNYWLDGTYIERVSYFGIVPLFFAIYALFSKKNLYTWFFIIAIVSIFFITFDSFITKFLYSIYIPPILATSVPTRIMFIFVFSASVLAAFGYNQFEKDKKVSSLIKPLTLMVLLTLSVWLFVYIFPSLGGDKLLENLSSVKRNMMVPSAILFLALTFIVFYKIRNLNYIRKYSNIITKLFFVAIVFLTILELYFFFQKFTPFSPVGAVYPSTSIMEFIKENQQNYRVWGYGSASLPVNVQTYEKVYSTDGYDPFYIRRYGELLSSTRDGKIPENIRRANAGLSPGFGDENLRGNTYRQKIMNLLGVKYIVHKKSQDNHAFDLTFDDSIYDLVWYDNDLQVYENKNVLARAFLVTDYEVISSDKDIIDRIYDKDFDIAKSVILEKSPGVNFKTGSNDYELEFSDYSENYVKINIVTENDALLVLSDSYFPEWKAYIDDNEVKIYRANYALRSILVPEGRHEVIFRYEPRSFNIGLMVSVGSILLSVLILVVIKLKK